MSSDRNDNAIIDLTPMRDLGPLTYEERMSLVPWTVEITAAQPRPRKRVRAAILASSVAVIIAIIAAALLIMSTVSDSRRGGNDGFRMSAAAAIAPPFSSVMPAAVPLPSPSEGRAGEAMEEGGSRALLSAPASSPPPPSRRTDRRRTKRIVKKRPVVRHPGIDEVVGRVQRPPTIDELVGRAAPKLPSLLSKRQIVGAMVKIVPQVRKCHDRFHVPGVADVKFKILHDGRIGELRVEGIFSGTPTGACVIAAVGRAKFPEFLSPSMKIHYPFVLR